VKLKDLKKHYGDEYPAAVISDGIRMPLRRETRFSRTYEAPHRKLSTIVSRFMDGSASISAAELQKEWPHWKESERIDFCQACAWLHKQTDFPEMIRFIMQHAGPHEWSAVALEVASVLPQDEAFDILLRTLRSTEIGSRSNITQAIAITKHPEAESVLREHLADVWAHPDLRKNAEFINWIAYDATTCISHLIEVGAQPEDFVVQVRELAKHACPRNRDLCRGHLLKHYSDRPDLFCT